VFSIRRTSLAAPDRVQKVCFQAVLLGEDGKGTEVDWLVPNPASGTHRGR